MSTLVKTGFERADRTFGVVEKNIKGSAESMKHNIDESIGSVRRNVEELASYIGLLTKVVESLAGIFLNKKEINISKNGRISVFGNTAVLL